ncbi:unnamed protein product [Angiostrongylus costaricensis]|uniref:ANF_receptor domain-containing protein n=1 Tax=Angiostrongylus costaricensis TaxID=334426 RepID=A0A0R3PRF8_ANGCS|nr:unnamed protein product [Angiostrongylus costaricensis]
MIGIATTAIPSLFYNDINFDVREGVQQPNTILPKLLAGTLKNVKQKLEWYNIGVKIDVDNYSTTVLLMNIHPNIQPEAATGNQKRRSARQNVGNLLCCWKRDVS